MSCVYFDVFEMALIFDAFFRRLRLYVNSEFEDLKIGKDIDKYFSVVEKSISYTVEPLGNGV